MQRILVPLLLTKNYADSAINYLWFEAFKALQQATEIIIGYRLPPTDFASEALLRTGLREKRHEIPVTIVNPDSSVKARFSEIFSLTNIKQVSSLDEFLNSF
jgi:hypothetical protein